MTYVLTILKFDENDMQYKFHNTLYIKTKKELLDIIDGTLVKLGPKYIFRITRSLQEQEEDNNALNRNNK